MRQLDKYNPAMFPTKTITVKEAAKAMNVSPNTVRRLLETGELHGGRFNTYWRVNEAFMHQYLRDNR